jgi:hypothetical protein
MLDRWFDRLKLKATGRDVGEILISEGLAVPSVGRRVVRQRRNLGVAD